MYFPKREIYVAVLAIESNPPGKKEINRWDTVWFKANPRSDFHLINLNVDKDKIANMYVYMKLF